MDTLEERVVLSVDLLSIAEVRESFEGYAFSGVTIVTHGFQFGNEEGDALMPLAEAIRYRIDPTYDPDNPYVGPKAWLLDYDIPVEGGIAGFDRASILPTGDSPASGELILLFDWAAESNEMSAGWGEAAGDALFSLLVSLDVIRPNDPTWNNNDKVPLHFIAHSFGSAVTSEAIERLAAYSIPVDHLTYLDPHDFDQFGVPVDEYQLLFELGNPEGYLNGKGAPPGFGAAVWNNVVFADVYYQEESTAPIPDGRPIPGAYNVLRPEIDPGEGTPHTHVWKSFYIGTIQNVEADAGYAFSRVADPGDRPTAPVYFTDQSHAHTPEYAWNAGPNLAGLTALGYTVESFTVGRWEPLWTPPFDSSGVGNSQSVIVNGDFTYAKAAFEWNYIPLPQGDDIVPGWSHHGGGGTGSIANGVLTLTNGQHRDHNLTYIDSKAAVLVFDLAGSGEVEVSLNGVAIGTVAVPLVEQRVAVSIPTGLRGKAATIGFRRLGGSGEARIDNIAFDRGGKTGDILPINLKELEPAGTAFEVVGLSILQPDGTYQFIEPDINHARKDYYFHQMVGGQSIRVGSIIFDDRIGGEIIPGGENNPKFTGSGELWFAPGTAEGIDGDLDVDRTGFQGVYRLEYKVKVGPGENDWANRSFKFRIVDGISGASPFGVEGGAKGWQAAELQQRLNYFGYADEGGNPLVIDGIFGPLTTQAITAFRGQVEASGDNLFDNHTLDWLANPSPPVQGSPSLPPNNNHLNTNGATQLREGLDRLRDEIGALVAGPNNPFNKPIALAGLIAPTEDWKELDPTVWLNIRDTLDLKNRLERDLMDFMIAVLDSTDTPSLDGLKAALNDRFGAGSAEVSFAGEEKWLNIDITWSEIRNRTLDIGSDALQKGLVLMQDWKFDLNVEFTLGLDIGINRTDGTATPQAFLWEIREFGAIVDVVSPPEPEVELRLGIVEIQASNAIVDIEIQLQRSTSGSRTLADLNAQSIEKLTPLEIVKQVAVVTLGTVDDPVTAVILDSDEVEGGIITIGGEFSAFVDPKVVFTDPCLESFTIIVSVHGDNAGLGGEGSWLGCCHQ